MKSKIFRVLFALVALFFVSPLMSQTLVFHHPDGTLSKVPLPATFSVTPSGDKLVIESGSTSFEIEKERILAMTYQSAKGDVNDDMAVNVADITTIVSILLGSSSGAGDDDKTPEGVEAGDDDKTPEGVEAVDLGLPSGRLWASMNVGASTPEDYGDYFAWGETTPKSVYNDASYKWCNGNIYKLTKYCNNSKYGYNGFTDTKIVLDMEDDAARANWGGDWRMPTKAEFEELINNTTSEWTIRLGVFGYKFTSKQTGNSNSIFLPYVGYGWSGELYDAGSYGLYWSSSLYESSPYYAWYFGFRSGYVYTYYDNRYDGHSVRPVR